MFEANLAKVHSHNAKGLSWREGVNQFTDMTEGEMAAYKGRVWGRSQNLGKGWGGLPVKRPDTLDWRDHGVVTPTKNQGGCGSCWAFSTTETVESAIAMATGKLVSMAPQGLVDCVNNVDQCGGTGGCAGATQELGFAWAMLYGMPQNTTYPYTAKDGQCVMGTAKKPTAAMPLGGISGYVRLDTNNYTQLMDAVASAGAPWLLACSPCLRAAAPACLLLLLPAAAAARAAAPAAHPAAAAQARSPSPSTPRGARTRAACTRAAPRPRR